MSTKLKYFVLVLGLRCNNIYTMQMPKKDMMFYSLTSFCLLNEVDKYFYYDSRNTQALEALLGTNKLCELAITHRSVVNFFEGSKVHHC